MEQVLSYVNKKSDKKPNSTNAQHIIQAIIPADNHRVASLRRRLWYLAGCGYAANRDCVVARSTLSQHASNPSTVPLLLAAYDAVWAKVEPRVTSDDTERVQDAIYLALITLSGAGQGDRVRLEAYALDRALAAMTAPRVADVGKIGGQGTG